MKPEFILELFFVLFICGLSNDVILLTNFMLMFFDIIAYSYFVEIILKTIFMYVTMN